MGKFVVILQRNHGKMTIFPICLYSLPMDPKFSSIKGLHCICFHSTFIKIDKISSTM